MPGGGKEGLNEIDVEVATHVHGIHYGTYDETFKKIKAKYIHQKNYANKYLRNFKIHDYMFWSPIVPVGKLTDRLNQLDGLKLIVNNGYTRYVDELKIEARNFTYQTGNPFFRTLQILECLRRD
jgi:hypothetical protein